MVAKKKQKTKIRYVDVNVNKGSFVSKLAGTDKSHDFSDVKLLRSLLSNEKARILHVLRSQEMRSIYALAKELKRDFKSVREDIKVLERFGFIEFHAEKTGKRKSLKPVLAIDKLQIIINI
jgi:predicted transcriptional regulator